MPKFNAKNGRCTGLLFHSVWLRIHRASSHLTDKDHRRAPMERARLELSHTDRANPLSITPEAQNNCTVLPFCEERRSVPIAIGGLSCAVATALKFLT